MMKIRLSLHRISTALVLLMSLLILLIPIKSPFNRYDEGCMVFNAVRILDGDRPHKDFWAVYPPGQFYLLAAVFKTFGPSLLPARVYDTLVRFGIIFCIYIVCQKITSHKTLPLIVVLICALLLASAGSFGYPVFPAMLFALISIFCLLMDVERKRIWWPVGMGALSGLAAFFRWDIALYCGLSTLVTFFLLRFRGRMNTALPSKARLSLLSEFLLFPAGTLGTLLPLYLFQCRRSGTVQLWEQVVGFPLTTLREENRLLLEALTALRAQHESVQRDLDALRREIASLREKTASPSTQPEPPKEETAPASVLPAPPLAPAGSEWDDVTTGAPERTD